MSQRESGYERKERDLYETPEWVTEALIPHLPRRPGFTWEPAMGGGKMVRAFSNNGLNWYGSDIDSGEDFLLFARVPSGDIDAVITNPPYELGSEFCEHALKLMESCGGQVAMLMRTDFDHAKSRSHLFRDCPAFAKKVVLTKRIVWFEPEPGSKGKSPSFNHAWFIWDWKHEGPPTIGYANGTRCSSPAPNPKPKIHPRETGNVTAHTPGPINAIPGVKGFVSLPISERFWAKVDKVTSGCWLWAGSKSPRGYGSLYVNGKLQLAHRVAYEMRNGPIPAGMVIDHLCKNTGCVNPEHLEAVAQSENVRRGLIGKTHPNTLLTHCKWGHEFTPDNTIYQGTSRRCLECRKRRDRQRRAKRAALSKARPSLTGGSNADA